MLRHTVATLLLQNGVDVRVVQEFFGYVGPFYDELIHFLMSPEDIVPVLALALLAGLRGANYGRRALFILPIAWLLGGLAGLSAITVKPHPFVAAAWFLLLGGLLAAAAKVSLQVTTALTALLGLLPRISERSRHGPVRNRRGRPLRIGVHHIYPDRSRCCVRGSTTCAMGSHCRPRRWKLDRSQEPLDARLGRSNPLDTPRVRTLHIVPITIQGSLLAQP